MKEYTEKQLKELGYNIENALITSSDLSMADHGCLTFEVGLSGKGWGCIYGGYCLGHGYLDAKEFKGTEAGLEAIMRIMDTVGVDKMSHLKGSYVRVAAKGWGDTIKIIGNLINDKWFDYESFFKDEEA